MASWLPIAKAILPYMGDIISVAKPVFIRKKGDNVVDQIEILQEQVEQLQTASLQNDHDIKALAEQFKTLIPALEQEIWKADVQSRRAQMFAVMALVLALAVCAMTGYLMLR